MCFLLCVQTPRAEAYEFHVRSETIGQTNQLRSVRFSQPSLSLNRFRLTQALTLSMWGFGEEARSDGRKHDGPRISFQSYLRVDHDFGNYTQGNISLSDAPGSGGGLSFTARNLIPELGASHAALDVLYAYAAIEGLWDGRIDAYIGRLMEVDSLDWWSLDGAKVRYHTPWPITVEAFGGLRVRDDSVLGSNVFEPDGTSGSNCLAYTPGMTPAQGLWRAVNENDVFDNCPDRENLMPTFGAAIETRGLSWLIGRLVYRRSVSSTPDSYPSEEDQSPRYGVNEEHLSWTLRAPLRFSDGKVRVTPFLAGRYSALHGLIDEYTAGVRGRYGVHSADVEAYYLYPTFDGDSIFNVFSTEPYTDLRLTYAVRPTSVPVSGYVRGWGRQYDSEDAGTFDLDEKEHALGAELGARYRHGRDKIARLQLFHEDGYGGRRTGGSGSATWRVSSPLSFAGRVSVIDFKEDLRENLEALTLGIQAGATYRFYQGMGLRLTAEQTFNQISDGRFRLWAILDLAYAGGRQ